MSVMQQRPATQARGAAVTTPVPAWRAAIRRTARELGLVAVLFLAYKLGRVAATGHEVEAMANAQSVWQFERGLWLPNEVAVQQSVLGHVWLVKAMNCYYAYVHFPATIAVLLFLWFRRREIYLRTRTTLAWLTAAALVLHLLTPLAPPRMLGAIGMIDTGRVFGPAVYASTNQTGMSNQYAAMPSLHVGWAIVIAIGLVAATRGRWRWAWLAHPVITLLVVVATGNHYWLDAIVVAVLLALVLALMPSRTRTPAPAPAARVPKPRAAEN